MFVLDHRAKQMASVKTAPPKNRATLVVRRLRVVSTSQINFCVLAWRRAMGWTTVRINVYRLIRLGN